MTRGGTTGAREPGAAGGAVAAGLGAVLDAAGPQLDEALALVERRLARAVAAEGAAAVAGLAADTLAAGGKRLRPILVFVCADGEAAREAVERAAAAVELLHMATLLHDDVLDRATLRRGRPTVFATHGRRAATATGDLLFSRAFAELTATGSAAAVHELSRASSALAHGELMQRADAWAADVTLERYVSRCELKTARLFEAACRLGALLGRPGAAGAAALGGFGLRVGLAFQMLDDVLDVSGPARRTGKRRGTDLLDGTVTLPLILARGRDAELAALDLRREVRDAAAAEQVCDRIAATGALEQSREIALEHARAAVRELGSTAISARARGVLELVADGIVARYA